MCQHCNSEFTKQIKCAYCAFTLCLKCFKSYITKSCNIKCMNCENIHTCEFILYNFGINYTINVFTMLIMNEQVKIIKYDGSGMDVDIQGVVVKREFYIDTGDRELDMDYSYNIKYIRELNVTMDDVRNVFIRDRKSFKWLKNEIANRVSEYMVSKHLETGFKKLSC